MRELIRGVVVAVVVLFLLECSARVVATFRDGTTSSDDFTLLGVEFSPDLGWGRKPNFRGTLPREPGRPERRFDARGFVPGDDVSSGPTIVAIGDSSTFGWGAPPDASYPRVLDELVPDLRVVNLGVLGYTSFQGYKALQKYGPALDPQLIIVATNYNDRRYVLSADDEDSDEKFQRDETARRMSSITSQIYLYRVVRFAMVKTGLAPSGRPRAGADDVRSLHVRVPPEKYRENLIRFAEYGKQAGVPVVFMTLADSPAYTEYLRRGVALLEKGDAEAATRELEIAVSLQNAFSDLARRYLAEALEKQGALDRAAAAGRMGGLRYSAAGGSPIYLDTEYNAIMRSVAREHGVTLVDYAEGRGRDPALYVDYCHPNERGYRVIAQLLHREITPLLAGRSASRTTAGLEEDRPRR